MTYLRTTKNAHEELLPYFVSENNSQFDLNCVINTSPELPIKSNSLTPIILHNKSKTLGNDRNKIGISVLIDVVSSISCLPRIVNEIFKNNSCESVIEDRVVRRKTCDVWINVIVNKAKLKIRVITIYIIA